MKGVIPDYNEYLLRVEAATMIEGREGELPPVPGWSMSDSVVDRSNRVRYATYSKIIKQHVTGDGTDIDSMSTETIEVESHLEAIFPDSKIDYEKRVYLISQPLAVWNTSSGDA